jgi:hypothetical protein
MDSTDAWHIALAVFLVLTGVTLAYVFFRLSKLLGDVETHLDETMVEVVPMLGKASITLDHVNDELEKVGKITDSAVGAVGTVDHAARAASSAAAKPAKVVSGLSEGVEHAFQSLKSKRRQRGGVV